jgi:hypothetical protein
MAPSKSLKLVSSTWKIDIGAELGLNGFKISALGFMVLTLGLAKKFVVTDGFFFFAFFTFYEILTVKNMLGRVERNRNMQKSTRTVVLKVADTHYGQLLFHNFPKF